MPGSGRGLPAKRGYTKKMVATSERKHQGVGELPANLPVAGGCAPLAVEDRIDKWWMVEAVLVERWVEEYWHASTGPRHETARVLKWRAMTVTGRLKITCVA